MWFSVCFVLFLFLFFLAFCFALYHLCCSLFCLFISFGIAMSFFFLSLIFMLFLFPFFFIYSYLSVSGFILFLYLLILATILSVFVFSSSDCISRSLLLWKRLMVHYHIQCGLCSVRRPYMNLLNFIVYYHNIAK